MSFDISFQYFKNGDSEPLPNPLRAKLNHLIQATQHDGQDDYGYYVLEFSDGSSVEMNAKGIKDDPEFSGVNFHLRGFADSVLSFLYKLGAEVEFTLVNPQAGEGDIFAIFNEGQREHLPEDFTAKFCQSEAELRTYLEGDFENWSDYKDKVLETYERPTAKPNKQSLFQRLFRRK